jgi:AraC family transcriptional regulator
MARVRYIERTSRTVGGDIDLDILKRKSWPGIAAEFVRFAPPEDYDFRLAENASYLALLNIHRNDGETVVPGFLRDTRKDLRNKLTFVPAGCELTGWSEIDRPGSVTAVYFEPCSSDDGRADPSQFPPMLGFEDNMLRAALSQFQAVLNDPNLDTPGYAETLGVLLAYELGRFKNQLKQPAPLQGGLTARQVRLVIEFLESRLTDKTSVSELAALVDLSRFHFIRAFKKTVGMPPHQYLVHRRVERAKELLSDQRLSVTEIAEKSGFNSTTQLTRSFRRIVGTTPSSFRREAI